MKIEIGESLIYSWLCHVKKCRIVQTNWKPSKKWSLFERDRLEMLVQETKKYFRGEYDHHIYKDNKGLSQLLKQAEIDVLGIDMTDTVDTYIAIDVAFHLGGTDHGSRKETVERIIKKLLRSTLCLHGYLGISSGEVIFASPKIGPAIV